MNLWKILGLAPTRDRSAIRRAYAQKLKQTHPEDDPEGFQRLREAYELALASSEPEAPTPLYWGPDEEEEPSFSEPFEGEPVSALSALEEETPPPGQQSRLDQLKLQLLRALYDKDDNRALFSWEEIRSLPSMVAIETKWRFEEWTLWTLHDRELSPPPSLVRAMDAVFDWTERRKHRSPDDVQIVDSWLSILRASDLIDALREEASGWPKKSLRYKRAVAASLLVGPFRLNLLLWAACHHGVSAAMQEIWREIATFDEGAVRQLDPKVSDWWRRRVAAGFPWWIRTGRNILKFTLAVSGVVAASFGVVVVGLMVTPVDNATWLLTIAGYSAGALLVVPFSYLSISVPVVALLRVAEAASKWQPPRALGRIGSAITAARDWCGLGELHDSSELRRKVRVLAVMILVVSFFAAFILMQE